MDAIVLSPKHPRDVGPEALESLASELRSALADSAPGIAVRIEVGDDEHRVGVTFIEVVQILIVGVGGLANLTQVTQAARSWLKRRSKEKNDRRPRMVNILGPDGKVLLRVELDDGADDVRLVDLKKR